MYWTYDRPDRLRALADRAGRMAENLRRDGLDAPRGSEARAAVGRRLALVERRRDRLRLLARVARHNARPLVASIGEEPW